LDFKRLAASTLKSLSGTESPAEVTVTFGPNFVDEMNSIIEHNSRGKKIQATFEFPDELLQEIDNSVSGHASSENVLYSEEMQFLDVVGESFHQEQLASVLQSEKNENPDFDEESGSEWYSGFLVPEPWNPFDANAVMVLMIVPSDEGLIVVNVGHLAKLQAKKVQKKIIHFLSQGAVIPLLMKLTGGTSNKPNIGVLARAKTKAINFDYE
jgi:hypothetical protein